MSELPILIAGGGPGGLCAAAALLRRGFAVQVLERAPELRVAGAGIALQINAMRMLASIGLARPIETLGAVLREARVEDARGRALTVVGFAGPAVKYGHASVAIHRAALSRCLAEALPADGVRFEAGVARVEQDDAGVTVTLDSGEQVRGAALIGADGIHSVVRTAVFGPVTPRYSGYTCWRGIAPRASGLGQGISVERWGRGHRFGVVPIGEALTYWFATENTRAGGADEGDLHLELVARFAPFASPVTELIGATPVEAILRNDIIDLPPLATWTKGRVALLGDAAHAMTPNMGQGACQAIEDGIVLAASLAAGRDDLPAALRAYEAARRPRALQFVNNSWRFGRIAQWQNAVACALRDLLIRLMPARVAEKQAHAMWAIDAPD